MLFSSRTSASCCTAARRRHTRRPLKAFGSSPMVDAMAYSVRRTPSSRARPVGWNNALPLLARASLRPHSPSGARGPSKGPTEASRTPARELCCHRSRVLPRPGAAGRYLLARWSPRCRPARARCLLPSGGGRARPRWRRTSKGTTGYSARVLSASRRVQRLRLFGRQLGRRPPGQAPERRPVLAHRHHPPVAVDAQHLPLQRTWLPRNATAHMSELKRSFAGPARASGACRARRGAGARPPAPPGGRRAPGEGGPAEARCRRSRGATGSPRASRG